MYPFQPIINKCFWCSVFLEAPKKRQQDIVQTRFGTVQMEKSMKSSSDVLKRCTFFKLTLKSEEATTILKVEFLHMSPEDPRIGTVCVSRRCRCRPSRVLAVCAVHCALCVCFQAATYMSICLWLLCLSVCLSIVEQLQNTLTSLRFVSTLPNQYASLNHIILVVPFIFCCHTLHHAFYRSKRLKTIRNMEEGPPVFLLGQWGWDSCV